MINEPHKESISNGAFVDEREELLATSIRTLYSGSNSSFDCIWPKSFEGKILYHLLSTYQ
jgi:hypothetical protein